MTPTEQNRMTIQTMLENSKFTPKQLMEAYNERLGHFSKYLDPDTIRDPTRILCMDHTGYLYDGTDLIGNRNNGLTSYTADLCGNRATLIIGTTLKTISETDCLIRLALLTQAFRDMADGFVVQGLVDKAIQPRLGELTDHLAAIGGIMDTIVRSERGCVKAPTDRKWPEVTVTAGLVQSRLVNRKNQSCGMVNQDLRIKLPPSGLYSFDYAKGYALGYFTAQGKRVGTLEFSQS